MRIDDSASLRLQLVFGPTGCTTGGLSIDVSTIANQMAARGHSVSVLTMQLTEAQRAEQARRDRQGTDYVQFSKDVSVVRLPNLPVGDLAERLSVTKGRLVISSQSPADIVHVFSLVPNYLHLAAAIAARKAHVPLVQSPMMHPVRGMTWSGRGLLGIGMRCYDALAPRLACRADLIVAATRDEERFFKSRSATQIVTAPPGVDRADQATDQEIAVFRQRFALTESIPTVIAVSARDEPRKGLDLLRSVASRLTSSLPAARILIVGLENTRLRSPNIIYTGSLDNRDLAAAYATAAVAFVPSRYEAFSRVVIESWQQSRPVVVTSGVGLASEVRESGAGLVVPVDDSSAATRAILTFLCQPDIAAACGKLGRANVECRYEWPCIIDILERSYYNITQCLKQRHLANTSN